jgi:hypothetical protein
MPGTRLNTIWIMYLGVAMRIIHTRLKTIIFSWLLFASVVSVCVAADPPTLQLETALRWEAVADAQGYKVYVAAGAQAEYGAARDLGAQLQASLAALGIERAGAYRIAVSAYNKDGESKRSAPLIFIVGAEPGASSVPDPALAACVTQRAQAQNNVATLQGTVGTLQKAAVALKAQIAKLLRQRPGRK